MKKSEAAELVMMLIAAFPAAKTNGTTSAVYEQMLADLDAGCARKAVTRLIGTSKWLPTVSEIRGATADLQLGPRGTGEQAYQTALQAVRSVGRSYGGESAPAFKDPLINRAVGIFGSWNDFCSSPTDDPGGRARFIELYDQLAQAEREDFVSGIPLPKPAAQTPLLVRDRPRPALTAPVRSLVKVDPSRVRQRPAEPVHRKYTAEELDAALKETHG